MKAPYYVQWLRINKSDNTQNWCARVVSCDEIGVEGLVYLDQRLWR
jgi:hypothetical protein